MSKRTCSLPECERPHAAKGYCLLHWNRNRLHGDPRVTMKGKYHKVQYTEDGLRICKACKKAKPLSEYHKDKAGTDGYRAQCKPCRSEYMQGYHQENLVERRAYIQNRRDSMPEHVRALDRARYERDKEKRIALATESVHVRRARMKAAEYDRGITVLALRKRHGDGCCYCGVELDFKPGKRGAINPKRASIEHLLPISKGGSHTWENTTLACHGCNTSKNAKTLDEWTPIAEAKRSGEHVMVGQQALFPYGYAQAHYGPRQMAVSDQR